MLRYQEGNIAEAPAFASSGTYVPWSNGPKFFDVIVIEGARTTFAYLMQWHCRLQFAKENVPSVCGSEEFACGGRSPRCSHIMQAAGRITSLGIDGTNCSEARYLAMKLTVIVRSGWCGDVDHCTKLRALWEAWLAASTWPT
jgi:hypothetical protein